MILCGIITAIMGVIGAWNLTIEILGLFPRFRRTAVGTLKWKKTYRNVRYRGGKLPPYTNYVYTYQVGEREYRYRGSGNHTKRGLYQKAAMVYVKGFPRRAYPNKFTGFMEWMWGIFGIVMAALFGAILILAETGAIPK